MEVIIISKNFHHEISSDAKTELYCPACGAGWKDQKSSEGWNLWTMKIILLAAKLCPAFTPRPPLQPLLSRLIWKASKLASTQCRWKLDLCWKLILTGKLDQNWEYIRHESGCYWMQLIVVVVVDNVAVRVSNNFQQRNLYPIVMQSR